jgi:hypothetical protein
VKRLHLVEAGSAETEATRLALPEHVQLSLVGGIAESAVPSRSLGNRRAGVASALTDKSKLMEVRPHEEGSPQRAAAPRA